MKDPVDIRINSKIEKKQRILDAAAILFSKKQYHEVMVEDVARLASIAKGTVYNYFSSKEEIYFTIIRERMDNLLVSLEQKIKSGSDSRNALRSFVIHLYMFMMKYREFFLIYSKETLNAENQICSSISEMQDRLGKMLGKIIDTGISNCIFRKINSGFAADLILGSIYASVNRGIEKNYNDNEMIREREETFNFIYEGMSNHSPESPLKNKVIVLTRTEEQNRESSPLFKQAGASVISFPAIKIIPNNEIKDIGIYLKPQPDYIVFTSGNAVRIFSELLEKSDIRIDRKITSVAAVGTKTAEECILNNLTPDIIPSENSAAGLIKYFSDINIGGKKFFIPRSTLGREEFIKFLEEKKAVPIPVDIYTTTIPDTVEISEKLNAIFNTEIDVIIFASPSAVKNFLELTGVPGEDLLKKVFVASIGSTTSSEISEQGFKVDIQPEIFTMEGLRDSIIDFYKRRNSDVKE